MAFVLRQVRRVGVGATNSGRALVDGGEAGGANLKLGELVVVDLYSVPRVAIAGSYTLPRLCGKVVRSRRAYIVWWTYLCNDLWIGVEVQQASCKLRGSGMVVGFCEDTNRATQRNLQMSRLQLAMRKVCCELQASTNVVRILLRNPSTLNLQSYAKEVLSRQCHQVTPLK